MFFKSRKRDKLTIQQLEHELNRVREQRLRQLDAIRNLNEELSRWKARVDTSDAHFSEIVKERNKLRQELDNTQARMVKNHEEFVDTLTGKQTAIDNLTTLLSGKQGTIDSLTEELQKWKNEVTELQQQLDNALLAQVKSAKEAQDFIDHADKTCRTQAEYYNAQLQRLTAALKGLKAEAAVGPTSSAPSEERPLSFGQIIVHRAGENPYTSEITGHERLIALSAFINSKPFVGVSFWNDRDREPISSPTPELQEEWRRSPTRIIL